MTGVELKAWENVLENLIYKLEHGDYPDKFKKRLERVKEAPPGSNPYRWIYDWEKEGRSTFYMIKEALTRASNLGRELNDWTKDYAVLSLIKMALTLGYYILLRTNVHLAPYAWFIVPYSPSALIHLHITSAPLLPVRASLLLYPSLA